MVPKGKVVEVTTAEGFESRHVFTQTYPDPATPLISSEATSSSEGGNVNGGGGGGD